MKDWMTYEKIQELKRNHLNKSQVSRRLHIDYKTVTKYWDMPPDEFSTCRNRAQRRKRKADAYKDFIVGCLQSAIYLAYIYALNRYTVVKEMTSGKGFADVVFIPFKEEDPAMIIELKRNSCTESAIDQIRDKQYYDSLSHYRGKLLFVGINYDEKKKEHSCRIETFMK